MYKLSKLLSIPCFTTEHYSKIFGHTVPDLAIDTPVYEKRMFSMLTEEVKQDFDNSGRQSAILVGIEAHACILQTAMDLIEDDKDVFVICDAVSSQK
jgi:isochorismate hydrolase